MALSDITTEERLKRFLYTSSYHGYYITGNPDQHYSKLSHQSTFQWAKSAPDDFIQIITSASDDPLLVRRSNIFYILSEALHHDFVRPVKDKLKSAIFKLIKSDDEFFDFVKYHTQHRGDAKNRMSTTLRKMVVKFYQSKAPMELVQTVTAQQSYHCWQHKDLFKLCHFKCTHILCEPVVKYVMFGEKQFPENPSAETRPVIEQLKKCHELRTTENVERAVTLVNELHATVDRANSKLNKNEQVWQASLKEMTMQELLQNLYRFYKWGFLKAHSLFQASVCDALSNPRNVKKSNLHPIEVFIYLKVFEKGGKVLDPKLLEYLQKKELKENVLKRLTTPVEPKCKPVIQKINKCLGLSYANVQGTGKRFMITVDVTESTDDKCYHNKRITHFEAIHAIIRFLTKMERNVTVAVFKDDHIDFLDLSKSHSAIEKLQEHQTKYIIPSAPLDWARNKRKQIDVFINFMSCDWSTRIPDEVKAKMETVPEALYKYAKKMKAPETRVVKVFLGGASAAFGENSKNILSIGGFSTEVPRVLEAFCRGHFC